GGGARADVRHECGAADVGCGRRTARRTRRHQRLCALSGELDRDRDTLGSGADGTGGDAGHKEAGMTMGAANTGAGQDIRRAVMLIDGEWTASASGQTLSVENPAKRQPIAEIPRGNAEDVDR